MPNTTFRRRSFDGKPPNPDANKKKHVEPTIQPPIVTSSDTPEASSVNNTQDGTTTPVPEMNSK
jgi:bisphosphoglycerate-dependent phosphoglycerate mutase